MNVFITGASGFIGTAVVRELLAAGHQVSGLARSRASAEVLERLGVTPVPGELGDLDVLGAAARAADGVVALAFPMDFTDFAASAEAERRAVIALGEALAGSDRPLVVPSGTAMFRPGSVLAESDPGDPDTAGPRRDTELELIRLSENGVRGSVVRLATSVHGPADARGFVPGFIAVARDKGVSAYIGDGDNRWPAVHQLDAARLFRLALEGAPAGTRLHAVGETGIRFRDIAAAIGELVGVPTSSISAAEATDHFAVFGALATFAGRDVPASNDLTCALTAWQPQQAGLLADLATGSYSSR